MNRHQLHKAAEKTGSAGMLRLICFSVGKTVFGVDVAAVREIVRPAPLTAIPNAPDHVEGLMVLGGQIIPLIDFRKKICPVPEKTGSENSWIMVLAVQGALTGFRIDSVIGMHPVAQDSIKPGAGPEVSGIHSRYIAGTCPGKETPILLPDFNEILSGFDD